MLEQQHQLGQFALADLLAQALLQRRRLAVLDAAQIADPQLHAFELSLSRPGAAAGGSRGGCPSDLA
jgi:hypothetical protein